MHFIAFHANRYLWNITHWTFNMHLLKVSNKKDGLPNKEVIFSVHFKTLLLIRESSVWIMFEREPNQISNSEIWINNVNFLLLLERGHFINDWCYILPCVITLTMSAGFCPQFEDHKGGCRFFRQEMQRADDEGSNRNSFCFLLWTWVQYIHTTLK